MRIQFHIRGVNITSRTCNTLGESLERLQRLIPISAAAIVLEHRWDSAPTFRAFVLLAVPGPDIHAEARENTLAVAWFRVIAALRRQIQRRKARELSRITATGQRPIFAAAWSREGISTLISLKTIKRIAILVVGSTVLAIGAALLVLPGPAFVVIPLGLAILAMEFVWARRWLRKARNLLPNPKGAGDFTSFVARHTRNFLDWASVGPDEDTKRQTERKEKHETQKQNE